MFTGGPLLSVLKPKTDNNGPPVDFNVSTPDDIRPPKDIVQVGLISDHLEI
jgi:hypothetical protein